LTFFSNTKFKFDKQKVKSVGLDLRRIEIATIHALPAAMQSAMEVIKDLGKINKAPCRSLMKQPLNGDK